MFENFEATAFTTEGFNPLAHLEQFRGTFESNIKSENGFFQNLEGCVFKNDTKLPGYLESSGIDYQKLPQNSLEIVKRAFYGGTDLSKVPETTETTLGLKRINGYKRDINSAYYNQTLKAHAGFSAEVLSTAKENLQAQLEGKDYVVYRADDVSSIYGKNDQYVDKIRQYENGTVERIQTKFVGKNGEEWLNKMLSKKFDKYFEDGKVDKIECPADYYDDAMKAMASKKQDLTQQLEKVQELGKTEAAEQLQTRLQKLDKLEQMTEKSTVTTHEAVEATLHPDWAVRKLFAKEVTAVSHKNGLKSGSIAAGITFATSSFENIQAVLDGTTNAQDAVLDVAKDTAVSGALGYGTSFISTAVSSSLSGASSKMLQAVGGSCIPGVAVSFAVQSYDSVSCYCQGIITGEELLIDLGENAVTIAGSMIGSMAGGSIGTTVGTAAGTAIGSFAGPAGMAAGAKIGGITGSLVGGMVGCGICAEAYSTAVEIGASTTEYFTGKCQEFANGVAETVSVNMPEKLETVRASMNDYFKTVNIPVAV